MHSGSSPPSSPDGSGTTDDLGGGAIGGVTAVPLWDRRGGADTHVGTDGGSTATGGGGAIGAVPAVPL